MNKYPGVAQLGARVVWDHQAAGSIPVTRTISSVHNRFQLWTLDIFCLYLHFRLTIEFFEQLRLLFLFCVVKPRSVGIRWQRLDGSQGYSAVLGQRRARREFR